ncbi:MAG: DUF1566 domain-containing protein [Desulfobacteraceae bacterium]|nr:DUF1566 domain-containing protein [Desulfobacteraceae bacterium]
MIRIVFLICVLLMSVATGSTGAATSNSNEPYEGYNLFSSLNSRTVYLMNNDGNIVQSWDTGYRPGNAIYLLENGELLHTGNVGNSTFNAGGAGGIVQTIDWDGTVTWEYTYSSSTYLQHHDVEKLSNGNILMVAWQYKSYDEAVAAGRNPSKLTSGELWPDSVIEVRPTGTNTGQIVWEWHVWDHLVQDYDPSKSNYGVVVNHPELVDLNYTMTSNADWNHINSVDYNEELDQIVLSVHNFSEIWVIDHSTTTEEAAGHTGGNSTKGGDLLYRWGNPQTYDAGNSGDQQLFVQHDAEWIEDGYPGEGNILIFNNGQGRPEGNYSSIEEITPPVNTDGSYTFSGSNYGPDEPLWTYSADNPTDFYAKNISGQQRLPNGNTLICEGPSAHFFEVTDAGEIVWEYYATGNVFRVERYAPDYSGFDGTELDDGESDDNESDDGGSNVSYAIVDTGQATCYDDSQAITAPSEGEAFYGQDANYSGNQPSYTLSQDGLTVYDNVTGLIWTQSPDIDGDGDIDADDQLSFDDAKDYADILNAEDFGGYSDWRLPTIKELYSLMNFTGTDPVATSTDTSILTPFIDTDYFDFGYGDTDAGQRIIDAQFWSSNAYVGNVFNNQSAAFGLNLADGRIKGYPTWPIVKTCYIYFVRGNTDYGINNYVDNSDGTVTDYATGLMWSRDDSSKSMNWKEALAWVQQENDENYLGYSDWRLPNAKEMQSIVDYSRSPDTTDSAAIDPVFNITRIINETGEDDYPWFWTGTTHAKTNGAGSAGVYICFGRALGYMNGSWMDVHGAGAQRSDQKGGDFSGLTYVADGYYFDRSPQGDATRIYNHVRLVRDTEINTKNYCQAVPDQIVLDSISGTTDDSSPTLTWEEDACATWYKLYLKKITGGYKYVQWYEIEDDYADYPEVECVSGQCSITIDTVLESGSYQWWVKGWNDIGPGQWSDVMGFSISD